MNEKDIDIKVLVHICAAPIQYMNAQFVDYQSTNVNSVNA
jgi:hypothetical protein